MIPRLLLLFSAFSLISGEVTLDQLKWQPNLITKQSILTSYKNITPAEPPLFTDIPQLVFISDLLSQRGYYLAEKNAKRLNYVSFVWFIIIPKLNENEELMDLEIEGKELIDHKFIRKLRKLNPDVKIVPRFQFTKKFAPEAMISFVQREWIVQRTAQAIANFCREYGFDGAVIACPNLLSKGVFFDERFVGDDIHAVDLYRDMLETLEQVGNVIRRNKLIAILSMEPPVTPSNLESEARTFTLPPQFSRKMIDVYDFVHIWTYMTNELLSTQFMNRQNIHDKFLEENIKFFDNSPKLLVGINFFGYEFPLDSYLRDGFKTPWKPVRYDRYLGILTKKDAVLTFNEVNKEHELTSKSANVFIIYPSLTQLEYRLAHIKKYPGVGIGIWEYGLGLDYFTNLV